MSNTSNTSNTSKLSKTKQSKALNASKALKASKISIKLERPESTKKLERIEKVNEQPVIFYNKCYQDYKVCPYYNKGKLLNRLQSEEDFYNRYPDFNLHYYQNKYDDLKHMNKYQLMVHFHENGLYENRKFCEKISFTLKDLSQQSQQSQQSSNTLYGDEYEQRDRDKEQHKEQEKQEEREYLNVHPYVETMQYNMENIVQIPKNKLDTYCIDKSIYEAFKVFKESSGKQGKPIYLVISNWGYVPFGGGEMWLVDTIKWLTAKGYQCYYMYFNSRDSINGSFDEVKTIDALGVTFIQMPMSQKLKIYQTIKYINPSIISHQGTMRKDIIKIAKNLDIPIITGFCYWQDILVLKSGQVGQTSQTNGQANGQANGQPEPYNKNLLSGNNLVKADDSLKEILKITDNAYVCSKFVNDVICKYHHQSAQSSQMQVINSISTLSKNIKQYKSSDLERTHVTIINPKGSSVDKFISNIFKDSTSSIPFYLIETQSSGTFNFHHHQVEHIKEHVDLDKIYNKTKILLILSFVDETFCRVAYEGMNYGIPILSTNYGNLQYLLTGYADFLGSNHKDWTQSINNLYSNNDKLQRMSSREKKNYPDEPQIFVNVIEKTIINSKIYKLATHIGFLAPWADQGLGIQCRQYYDQLTELGYTVSVFSPKPNHSTDKDPRLQTCPSEWDRQGIFYSNSYRKDITFDEFSDYVFRSRISKFVIIEPHGDKLFEIANWAKMLNLKVYAIPNIEIIEYTEIPYYTVFDKVLCNNIFSFNLLNSIFTKDAIGTTSYNIGTSVEIIKYEHINYMPIGYSQRRNKSLQSIDRIDQINFFCCGGLNAISRKNIDKLIEACKLVGDKCQLYVYIQGIETINSDICKKPNIHIIYGSMSYKEIISLYSKHDVFVHLGGHEGLGLGFYEATSNNCPVLTLNCAPNNEIIKDYQNGWLIDCDFVEMVDNTNGIVLNANVTVENVIKGLNKVIKSEAYGSLDNIIPIQKKNRIIWPFISVD